MSEELKPAIKHPFTRALYELQSDGTVRVVDGDKEGLFKRDGRWISGELREADPQFCGWIAGDRVIRRGFDEKSDHS